ncbi:hypothetical protein G2W53_010670 [Senna tora]|uniref:DUF659 domain-containing protein n=1 Tax=Senna tora TaxID=362788 RepID=A0A835C9Q4_9FABA|nr:hypothetical protein G2W53_010670 [Senna tora]
MAGTKENVELCINVSDEVRAQLLQVVINAKELAEQKKRQEIYVGDDDEGNRQSEVPESVMNVLKNSKEFTKMCEMTGKYGQGFKPPSYHDFREKYLKIEKNNIEQILDEFKEEWKRVVEKVGEENVIQIVIDNAANYKVAGQKLMEKRKHLYWTPCAAHCIDLMLEDFEKHIPMHKDTISTGRRITTYIYGRTMLISMLKNFTKGRDFIRPVVTRFATSYLTLACLNEHKGALMTMFCSKE